MPAFKPGDGKVFLALLLFRLTSLPARTAWAVPSDARQTGLSCIACHQGYLALNS